MRCQILRLYSQRQLRPQVKLLCSNDYCTEVKPEKKTESPRSWRKPWTQQDGEWNSAFNWFVPEKGLTPDFIRVLQNKIDFRPETIKKLIKGFKRDAAILDMRYIPERHELLGSNLAAAHFLVHRGGSVRFVRSHEWVKREGDEYSLPGKYNPDYLIEAIDASNMKFFYEGFRNMTNLTELRWLSLQNCAEIDDWCLDKISGEYHTSLEYLDIGNCSKVTDRGIVALYRMNKLRTLKVHNIAGSAKFQLVCLMLEDLHPQLKIEGVDYIDVKHKSIAN